MPVNFDPLPVPRFDQSLLSYLSRSFTDISRAIKNLSSRQTLAPKFYTANSGSIAVGTGLVILTENSIIIAPYPLIMIVEIFGTCGFSAGPSQWDLDITDHAGVSIITPGVAVNITSGITPAGWVCTSLLGKREYNTGDTCGTRVICFCSVGNNVYTKLAIKVSFYPK